MKIFIVLLILTLVLVSEGVKKDRKKTCEHKGITYRPGQKFKDDCNKCKCKKRGNVVCTEKVCDVSVCEHDGVIYQAGDSFKMDCNTCICSAGGHAMCTLMACYGFDF